MYHMFRISKYLTKNGAVDGKFVLTFPSFFNIIFTSLSVGESFNEGIEKVS